MPKYPLTPDQSVLTIEETASVLRVSRASVWRLVRDKRLRPTKIGGRTLIQRIHIQELLDSSVEGDEK